MRVFAALVETRLRVLLAATRASSDAAMLVRLAGAGVAASGAVAFAGAVPASRATVQLSASALGTDRRMGLTVPAQ